MGCGSWGHKESDMTEEAKHNSVYLAFSDSYFKSVWSLGPTLDEVGLSGHSCDSAQQLLELWFFCF